MEKQSLKFFFLFVFSLVVCSFSGCYPNNDEPIEEYDIVATFYDQNHDFSKISTFWLIDTVGHGNVKNPKKNHDQTIITEVRRSLESLTWTSAESDTEADIIVFCSVINTDVYTYWYDYWYDWWWYWYGYYPYPYYPWSYGGITYSYSEGTVIIQMMDRKEVPQDTPPNTVVARWAGILNGVTNDAPANIERRIKTGVEQCFKQSTYL
ncbi:MAG: DUF4136 domain-containing protein [Bacteroidales bacterium]|nr:DUF4136 domain-containing protein [Bacteroidales bacterium]